jgi:hypothetical protein
MKFTVDIWEDGERGWRFKCVNTGDSSMRMDGDIEGAHNFLVGWMHNKAGGVRNPDEGGFDAMRVLCELVESGALDTEASRDDAQEAAERRVKARRMARKMVALTNATSMSQFRRIKHTMEEGG